MTWLLGYLAAGGPDDTQRRMAVMNTLNDRVLTPLTNYRIPAIKLGKGTSKEAVATVFEKVNTGGLPLNVFELLTATFAGDRLYYEENGTDFRLGEDWDETVAVRAQHPVLRGLQSTDLLQGVTLLATLSRRDADIDARRPKVTATSARREDILRLDLRDYLAWSGKLRKALPWVAHFLTGEHFHTYEDLPYRSQLVPLAVFRVILGEDIDVHAVRARIRQWFWCGVLGELYGSTIETKLGRDAEQVPGWARAATGVDQVPAPDTVARASFSESRLWSLHTRQSAAYKGVYALLMAQPHPVIDWKLHQVIDHVSYQHLKVDIHHVFPKAWCMKNDIDPSYRESIVNKTPLAKKTNQQLGGVSPREYMLKLDSQGLTATQVDDIVRTHSIDPETLRAGDFDAYFSSRRNSLVFVIQEAMGKPVNRDWDDESAAENSPDAFEPEADDPEEDTDFVSAASEGDQWQG